MFSHSELVIKAERWLRNQNCGVVFRDEFRPATGNGELPDAIGFRRDSSILIECKASRSDFLSDKKKRFRVEPELGMGDWRFFMCPPNTISPDELPDGWGLLIATKNKIIKAHGVPQNARWYSRKPFSGNKNSEMDMMYSALRRMNIRGCLDRIYDKIPVEVSCDNNSN